MITGKTPSGFEFTVEKTALNNMELLDAIIETEDNPVYMSKVVQLLLGPEGKKRLYDHLRTEAGNIPLEAVDREIQDILKGCGDAGKN